MSKKGFCLVVSDAYLTKDKGYKIEHEYKDTETGVEQVEIIHNGGWRKYYPREHFRIIEAKPQIQNT